MKYDVFISYSRRDTIVADRICKAFDKSGISYFIDRQEIGGGFEFPTVLADTILNSSIILFLASMNSYESKFTITELTFAFNEKPKNSILPYIIDGSILPPTFRFLFASINWRTIESHPIDTVLVNDILNLLGHSPKQINNTLGVNLQNNKFYDELSQECKSKSLWKVGDYYSTTDKSGIVFWVDKEGKHGKVVSLDQANLPWCLDKAIRRCDMLKALSREDGYKNTSNILDGANEKLYPALLWCINHGDGWYMPALDEVMQFLNNDIVINALKRFGKHTPSAKHHWTSSEVNAKLAYTCSGDREYDKVSKNLSFLVRAVYKF